MDRVMDLNDLARFRELDRSGLIAHLDALPEYLQAGFSAGRGLQTSSPLLPVAHILICAVGSAALAADGLVAILVTTSAIPVTVNRTAMLPSWANAQTLIITLSQSAHEIEPRQCALEARQKGFAVLELAPDGTSHVHAILLPHGTLTAHLAFGVHLGALIGIAMTLGLLPDGEDQIQDAVAALNRSKTVLTTGALVMKNPAKRLAGQMVGRTPIIYGAGLTATAARRWKQMLNLLGKTLATAEELPDLNYHATEGLTHPLPLMTKLALVFLTSDKFAPESVPPRWELTRAVYIENGFASDTVKGRGDTRLAHLLTLVQFGDYVSYFVAMAYGVDPAATVLVDDLRDRLHTRLQAPG